jgi:hypothetical protein
MQWEINTQARAPIGVATIDPAATCLSAPIAPKSIYFPQTRSFLRAIGVGKM